MWYYYIYASYGVGAEYSGLVGDNVVSFYYDGETGLSDIPYYTGMGYNTGGNGIGSEGDYVRLRNW